MSARSATRPTFDLSDLKTLAFILVGAPLYWFTGAAPDAGPHPDDEYFKGLPMAGTTIGRADAPVCAGQHSR